MVKILLIDNYSSHINEIKRILLKLKVEVHLKNITELKLHNIDLFDGVILSGGSRFALIENPDKYLDEIKLIKEFKKPILGICMGFEVLCYAFQENIEYLGFKEIGLLKIEFLEMDPILNNLPSDFYGYEVHRWGVKEVKNLKPIAKSEIGIEIVKHKSLPYYGIQFHPEVQIKGENSEVIFENFVEIINNIKI